MCLARFRYFRKGLSISDGHEKLPTLTTWKFDFYDPEFWLKRGAHPRGAHPQGPRCFFQFRFVDQSISNHLLSTTTTTLEPMVQGQLGDQSFVWRNTLHTKSSTWIPSLRLVHKIAAVNEKKRKAAEAFAAKENKKKK